MRSANFICLPDHKIWKLKTPEEVKIFLQDSFPQLELSDYVTDEVNYIRILYIYYYKTIG